MKTSRLFSIDLQDAIKGLIVATGGAVISAIETCLNAGSFNFNWRQIGLTALAAGVAYLGKISSHLLKLSNMMQLSDHGEAIIKNFEGLRLSAYRDTAGIWTIGYGSTRYHDENPVKPGDKLAGNEQADALFRNTLGAYVAAVNHKLLVKVNQNQFDALVSFTYNTGIASGKTLFEKLNIKDYQAAADQFLVWNKITDPHTGNKIISPVLTARRQQERALFLKK